MKTDNKFKINIIDALAVLLLIAVIIGLGARFKSPVTTSVQSNSEYIYTVKVEGVRIETVKALEKSTTLTDKKTSVVLGEIIDVTYEDAAKNETCADGTIVNAKIPERYNATVTVKTNAKESPTSYVTADSNELCAGSTVDIITKYVKTSGKVMSIKKSENK